MLSRNDALMSNGRPALVSDLENALRGDRQTDRERERERENESFAQGNYGDSYQYFGEPYDIMCIIVSFRLGAGLHCV